METFTVSGWFGASTAEVTLKLRPSFCPGARPQLDVSPLQWTHAHTQGSLYTHTQTNTHTHTDRPGATWGEHPCVGLLPWLWGQDSYSDPVQRCHRSKLSVILSLHLIKIQALYQLTLSCCSVQNGILVVLTCFLGLGLFRVDLRGTEIIWGPAEFPALYLSALCGLDHYGGQPLGQFGEPLVGVRKDLRGTKLDRKSVV